jgi:hypothetical protein
MLLLDRIKMWLKPIRVYPSTVANPLPQDTPVQERKKEQPKMTTLVETINQKIAAVQANSAKEIAELQSDLDTLQGASQTSVINQDIESIKVWFNIVTKHLSE